MYIAREVYKHPLPHLLILLLYQSGRQDSSSSNPRLGQPSPYARHDLVRLAIHVDVNHLPIGSIDYNVPGNSIQTTSANDGGPQKTPQPLEWANRSASIMFCVILAGGKDLSYIARPSSQDLGSDNVPKR